MTYLREGAILKNFRYKYIKIIGPFVRAAHAPLYLAYAIAPCPPFFYLWGGKCVPSKNLATEPYFFQKFVPITLIFYKCTVSKMFHIFFEIGVDNAGKKVCRTGGRQNRRDSGLEGCKKRAIQDWRETGKKGSGHAVGFRWEGCGTRGMLDMTATGNVGCKTGGMKDRWDEI